VFLTWEANHAQMVMLKEHKQTVLIWGHYETEKIGPKLLAYHLKKKFEIEIVFLDEKY
jgi:putative NIF3 family GTP cyclohydrolase 1 type 2